MDPLGTSPTRAQRLLDALQRLPPGPTRLEIQSEAGMGELDAQVLRRLLVKLIQEGRLRAEGETRSRRYFLADVATAPNPATSNAGKHAIQQDAAYPPLSPQGEKSRKMLALPLSRRQPVSYQRAFLDAYHPNESYYLSSALRERLTNLGGPKEPERPAGTRQPAPETPRAALGAPGGGSQGRRGARSGSTRSERDAAGCRSPSQPGGTAPAGRSAASGPLNNEPHCPAGPSLPSIPAGAVAARGGSGAGCYARQILQRLLVDLSWNSARLEGNTYTLLDTERLIELGEAADGKDLQETQMILNHKGAIEFLVESAEGLSVDATTIQNLHALLTENLMANPMDEGQLRSAAVGIRGTSYIPTAVPQVIEECFRQILRMATEILDPFEQSFFLLVHLPYLQPFIAGNKRTARLAANIPFIRQNYKPITFMDVPTKAFMDGLLAVYEQNQVALLRDIYSFAYERSCARYGAVQASLGEPDPFRLRYRSEIKAIVREVVLSGKAIPEAEEPIRAYAKAKLPKESWTRFLTVVETELTSLHDGNYARYQLRPSEFAAWQRRR